MRPYVSTLFKIRDGVLPMRSTKILAAAASMLALSAPALAAGDAAAGLQAMKELNVIVLGDMKAGHDVEGKTFVGGSISGNGIYGIGNGSQGQGAASDRATVTVVGSFSGGNINNGSNGGNGKVGTPAGLVAGGSAGNINFNAQNAAVQVGGALANVNGSAGSVFEVGGAFTGNLNGTTVFANKGGAWSADLQTELVAQRDQLVADLTALSTSLGALGTTAGSSYNNSDFNNAVLTGVAGADGFAVINIDAATFFNAGGISYNIAQGVTTIVNISGAGNYAWNMNPLGSQAAYNSQIIYNFLDAASLSTNRMVHGSILAPYATVSNSTPIEGTLVAKTFNQGGEVHLGNFAGNISFGSPESPVGGVPEPATWAMLIAGFGLVGLVSRRRNARLAR